MWRVVKMNECFTIEELISGYYEREFSQCENTEKPSFSHKHKRKMNKIFAIKPEIDEKKSAENTNSCRKPLSIKTRIIIAAVIVIFMAFLVGGVNAFVAGNINATVYDDNIRFIVSIRDDCPVIIEEFYSLSTLPEGYSRRTIHMGKRHASVEYVNGEKNVIMLSQFVKRSFNYHIGAEKSSVEKTEINGFDALSVEVVRKNSMKKYSHIVWDSDDYIFVLSGELPREEIVNLAVENEFIRIKKADGVKPPVFCFKP